MDIRNRTVAEITAEMAGAQAALLNAVRLAAPHWNTIFLSPTEPERSSIDNGDWSPRFACAHVALTHWQSTDMALAHVEHARQGRSSPNLDAFRTDWWRLHDADFQQLWALFGDYAAVPDFLAIHWERLSEATLEIADSELDLPWAPGDANTRYLRSFGIEDTSPAIRTLLTLNVVHVLDHAAQIATGRQTAT